MVVKKSFLFFLSVLITASIFTEDMVAPDHIDRQMKTFLGRLRVYYKCLSSKCPEEKRRDIVISALQDGASLFLVIGTLLGTTWFISKAMSWKFKQAPGESAIQFDRENISHSDPFSKMEGYWALKPDPKEDKVLYGKYPFPQANTEPWPGKKEFLEKLEKIEQLARDGSSRIVIQRYKGAAPSRLETSKEGGYQYIFIKGQIVGDSEYFDKIARIGWTDVFGSYYVDKFNVKPSREFYRYVMNF